MFRKPVCDLDKKLTLFQKKLKLIYEIKLINIILLTIRENIIYVDDKRHQTKITRSKMSKQQSNNKNNKFCNNVKNKIGSDY